MGIFSNIKDNFTSTSAKLLLRNKIERYGRLLELDINSTKKKIFLSIMLTGEDKPVEFNIKEYSLTNDFPIMIKFGEIDSNREWITRVAKDYVENKKFPLPEKYTPIIKLLL